MMGGMRVAGAALALGLLGASVAKADTTYNFGLSSGTVLGLGSAFTAGGSFTLNGFGGVTGGNATLGFGGTTYNLTSATGTVVASIVNLNFSSAINNVTLNLQGSAPNTGGTLSGRLIATASVGGASSRETGFFSAGPSGGNSGGAPAPELGTLLGLTLAGGTLAFMRRRRGEPSVQPLAA